MRRSIIFAFVVLVTSAAALPASAQVIIEMSQITCRQYLTSEPDRRAMIAAWMSGYFSASRNLTCWISSMSSTIKRSSGPIARNIRRKR